LNISAMATWIFLVAIRDVRAFEKSNIHNPIIGSDTFNISIFQYFFCRINTALVCVIWAKNLRPKSTNAETDRHSGSVREFYCKYEFSILFCRVISNFQQNSWTVLKKFFHIRGKFCTFISPPQTSTLTLTWWPVTQPLYNNCDVTVFNSSLYFQSSLKTVSKDCS
jgi:hypothetical protein